MNKYKINSKTAMLANLIPLLALIICVGAIIIFIKPQAAVYNDEVTLLLDGWVDPDGNSYTISELPNGDIELTHTVWGLDVHRKRLCFVSLNTTISASFDGEVTYIYSPDQANILGRSYGQYIHMIPIPENTTFVTLRLHPVYEGTSAKIKDPAICDAGLFVGNIYQNGLASFALCLLISLFGVLMIILGFTTRATAEDNTLNFFSLGAFAILIGIWSANDTLILQVYTHHPEMVRFINFISLIFLAYPPVSFMASATGNNKTILLPVLKLLTATNFILTITLSILGVSDIKLMLPFSHINVIIALLMTVYLMIKAVRNKTIDRRFAHTVSLGMFLAVAGVVTDLIRYLFVKNSRLDTALFTKTGVTVFILLMGLHLMRERTRLAVEQGQAELMRYVAYTDGLTGLNNRAAFHLKEKDVTDHKTACTVIQLDINFLKKVNDDYGHAEGDRHIIAAANIIKTSFEGIGTSYRTGGDEFIVIATTTDQTAVIAALEKLEKMSAEYNAKEKPPVPLRLAYGCALYTEESESLEAAEKIADKRMYEKKKHMKSEK